MKSLVFERGGQSSPDSKIIAALFEGLAVETFDDVARRIRSRLVPEKIIDVDETGPGAGVQEGAPAGERRVEIDKIGGGEASPDPIEASGQREIAQVLLLEVGTRGALLGGRE